MKSDRDFTRKYLPLCLRYEIVGSGLAKSSSIFPLIGMREEWAVEDFAHHQNAQSEAILELYFVCDVALVCVSVAELFKQGVVLWG